MKFLRIVAGIFLILFTYTYASGAPNGSVRQELPYQRYEIVEYKEGVRQGISKTYETDTNLLVGETPYVDGKKEGVVKTFLWNGHVNSECSYHADLANGLCRTHYLDGQINSEVQYVQGKRQGLEKKYFENGQIQSEVKYIDDKQEGPYVWYHQNGKVMSACNYKSGKIDGECKSYDEYGNLIQEVTYSDGLASSDRKIYYPSGKLKQIEKHDPKGRVLTSDSYYENGQLNSHIEFNEKNSAVVWQEYFDDGTLKKELKNGKFISTDPNKELNQELKYLNETIAKNPKDSRSLISRGSLFLMQHKYNEAITDLTRAESTQSSAGHYEILGVAYLHKGNTAKAIEYMEKSVNTMCCQPHQMRNAALAHLKGGNYDKVLEYLKCASKLCTDSADAWDMKALAYQGKGQTAEATAAFEEAIRSEPDNSIPYLWRADAAFRRGDLASAWGDVQRAKEKGFVSTEEFAVQESLFMPVFLTEAKKRLAESDMPSSTTNR